MDLIKLIIMIGMVDDSGKNEVLKNGFSATGVEETNFDGASVTNVPSYAYSSGKAAVRRLSKVLAGHLALENITVNCILPGAFHSRMMRATIAAVGDTLAKTTPRQRIGNLKDMAGACIYLSSRAGAWLTGAEINVDGGALLKVDLKIAGAAL